MDPIHTVDMPNSPRQWLLVIILNLAVLTELFVAMYVAAAADDDFTAAFIKCFFGMLIPTLVLGFMVKRRLLRPAPGEA
jgi:hypothetical protein